jgi:TP53 regulating kinase-like protein
MKILHRGAEAILYVNEQGKLVKERIKKSYRINQIDQKLRKFRTRREGKLLRNSPVPVPEVFEVDENDMKIIMDYIKGDVIKDILDNSRKRKKICRKIGEQVAKLHDNNIIHGDLTTSNMILKNGVVYFIDFGLGFTSDKTEDKAVDIHLLKQALEAKHHKHSKKLFNQVLKGYKKSPNSKEVLARLEKVGSRGRYKKR